MLSALDPERRALEKQFLTAKVDRERLHRAEHVHADDESRPIFHFPDIEDMEITIYQCHVGDFHATQADGGCVEQLARHNVLCRAVNVGHLCV